MLGCLPPNITAPEGQGSVLFTVRQKSGLPTTREIRNRATIVFDVNPPIELDPSPLGGDGMVRGSRQGKYLAP